MTRSNALIRAAMFVAVLTIAGSACASSTTVASPPADPTTAPSTGQDPAPVERAAPEPEAEAESEAPPSSDPAPTEPAAAEEVADVPDVGQETVEVVFDDGRTWTLQATDCKSNPDQGQALLINATGEGTLEFGAVITRPLAELTNEDAEQLFIATFIDDQDQLYVFEDPESIDTAADGSVSFTAKLHTNIFYQLGDEPAAIGTFSC